jgi:hypothetical protein
MQEQNVDYDDLAAQVAEDKPVRRRKAKVKEKPPADEVQAEESETAEEPEIEAKQESLEDVDPFDPARFRFDAIAANVGSANLLVRCPLVKVPKADVYVRASSDPNLTDYPCALLTLETEREDYLLTPTVAQALAPDLGKLVKLCMLTLGIDRQGNPFLWWYIPRELPGGDNDWHATRCAAVVAARKKWVRVAAGTGGYDVTEVKTDIPEPTWPNEPMRTYLKLAFGDRVITAVEHSLVQRLLGNIA